VHLVNRREPDDLIVHVHDGGSDRRETRIATPGHQLLLGRSAENVHDVQPAAVAFGAEDDLRAIGRERGPGIVGLVTGETVWLPAADVLDVDVQIPLAAAVRGVRDQFAVR
jgi:hypothetical protein